MRFLFFLIISFSLEAAVFKEEYNFLLSEIVGNIEDKCNKKIKKNIVYKWMPKGLEYIEPSLAFVSFHRGETWVEFRSSFKELSLNNKRLIVYHEIGHVYGLEHKDKSIMTNPIEKVVEDYEGYFKDLCQKLE